MLKYDHQWHFDKFTELARICEDLLVLVEANADFEEKASQAKTKEHEADLIIREIVLRLRSKRRLPPQVNKGTIFASAHNIDNVIDQIEKAVDRMKSYKIALAEPLPSLIHLLSASITEIKQAIACLKTSSFLELETRCERIKHLESEADKIHRAAVAKIAEDEDRLIASISEDRTLSPIQVKNIMRRLKNLERMEKVVEIFEQAFDESQDVADFLENLRYEFE